MSRFAVMLTCLTFAASASAEEDNQEARDLYDSAQVSETAGEFEDALELYRQANDLRPSYRFHRHMGRVCAALGRTVEALNHYQNFIDEGGDRVLERWRTEITRTIASLRSNAGVLRFRAPFEASINVDGQRVTRNHVNTPYWVAPGRHSIEATLAQHRSFTNSVRVSAGQEISVEILLEPEDQDWQPDEYRCPSAPTRRTCTTSRAVRSSRRCARATPTASWTAWSARNCSTCPR